MEKIDHNAHSVYLMYYHLIMVVKYRRKVINDPISERAKEIWEYIAPRYGIVLEEWNHDIDHVHVMFRAQSCEPKDNSKRGCVFAEGSFSFKTKEPVGLMLIWHSTPSCVRNLRSSSSFFPEIYITARLHLLLGKFYRRLLMSLYVLCRRNQ